MAFGERLHQLRKQTKTTGEKLGSFLGVNKANVSLWEHNFCFPNTDNLIKIADYFSVSIDYLLCRTDDPRPVDKYSIDDGQIVYIGNLPNDKKEIVKEIIKSFNKVD